jgi:TonB family protein
VNRSLVAAGLSVALHAGALLFFAREVSPAVVTSPAASEKPLQVEVMRTGLVSAAPRPAAAPVAVAPVAAPARAVARRPETIAPAGVPQARPSAITREEESGDVEEGGLMGGVPDPVGGDPAPSTVAESKGARGADAPLDTAALSRRLQQVALRCYPAAARRFRQTGEAQVRFCLDGAGALRESTVVHSAGSDLLDRAARECVVPGAAPFGPETFGRCFTVPVRFNP